MKIDYNNKNLINEKINIHDSIFSGLVYENKDKKLIMEMDNYCLNKKIILNFYNVLILNCEMCQFWGKSPNVLDWRLSAEKKLIGEIIKKQNENEELYKFSLVNNDKNYIETTMTLTSGDIISIVCEYINIEETTIDMNNKIQ